MAIDPNELLCVYLGAGLSGGYDPVGRGDDRLRRAYPSWHSEARAAISKYLDTPVNPPSEWTTDDLAKEQEVYEGRLRAQFPELNERATNALACRWSFGWR